MRHEREAVTAAPDRVASAATAAGLAGHPAQLDEPERGTEITVADLLGFDGGAKRAPGLVAGDRAVDPLPDRLGEFDDVPGAGAAGACA
jgi:hypothetical protein